MSTILCYLALLNHKIMVTSKEDLLKSIFNRIPSINWEMPIRSTRVMVVTHKADDRDFVCQCADKLGFGFDRSVGSFQTTIFLADDNSINLIIPA
jgi:hypothetical protein